MLYGTVARLRLKPSMEARLVEHLHEYDVVKMPGAVVEYVYRSEADPNEYYMVVVFASKEAYIANANSPEQAARYSQLRELLAEDPEWHDGEIVYAGTFDNQERV